MEEKRKELYQNVKRIREGLLNLDCLIANTLGKTSKERKTSTAACKILDKLYMMFDYD